MKKLTLILLALLSISGRSYALDEPIDPDTARAYEAYLVTFIWPEDKTSEQIDYKNILTTEGLLRFTDATPDEQIDDEQVNQDELELTKIAPEGLAEPFANIAEKLGKQVRILSNQQWTLIFKRPGDVIEKTFYSEEVKDGYPELTADIQIKLGRYLESDIHYEHFLFDSFTQPDKSFFATDTTSPSFFSSAADNTTEHQDLKAFEPALVLKLNMHNKTASKKLNYLDHPTIGTLLFFQPLNLEEAVEKITLQTISPETGQSLNFDELNSTNELETGQSLNFDELNSTNKLDTPQAIIAPLKITPIINQ
ncbi:hypothetical protein [Marinomonas sp. THO17]|uniref:hypothetical protein n=1 Tax=Marinomonas sp. THO17 TaxID=3149048 RepID=UPI00336BE4DF